VIPTHEFAGNLHERLDFPNDWEINVMDMKGHNGPVLTPQQIVQGLNKPKKGRLTADRPRFQTGSGKSACPGL